MNVKVYRLGYNMYIFSKSISFLLCFMLVFNKLFKCSRKLISKLVLCCMVLDIIPMALLGAHYEIYDYIKNHICYSKRKKVECYVN